MACSLNILLKQSRLIDLKMTRLNEVTKTRDIILNLLIVLEFLFVGWADLHGGRGQIWINRLRLRELRRAHTILTE